MHRHQAHHAHRAHPPVHPVHHGHCDPIRLLLGHQAAPGSLGSGGIMLVQISLVFISLIYH